MQEKLAITIILISLALFALIFVLYRIVNENSERYNKIVLSQRQQEYASRTIPYRRGDIVDRNGTYLATSEKVYNLILDPSQIMDKPDYYLEPIFQVIVLTCPRFSDKIGKISALYRIQARLAYGFYFQFSV